MMVRAELGVIRTKEALEASRVAGADLYFLNLRDAGNVKSAEKVLELWNHHDLSTEW